MLVLPSYVSSSSSMRPHTGVLQIPESGSACNPICAVCIKRMRMWSGLRLHVKRKRRSQSHKIRSLYASTVIYFQNALHCPSASILTG